MDVSAHDYVATPSEIGALARGYFSAQSALSENRVTYLRSLIATTQIHLKQTSGDPLGALETTHNSFYAEVLSAAQESTPPRTQDRAAILNRKTNFARSSVSMLRSWMKSGGDILKLSPQRVTKSQLAVARRTRAPSATRLKARVEARSKALVASLLALGEVSHATAAEELELLMSQLTDQLGAITGGIKRATRKFQAAKTQVLTKTEVARALQQ